MGDCAGMAADVFETYAVSLIGALLLGTLSTNSDDMREIALALPFLLGGVAIIGSILGVFWVNLRKGSASRLLMEGVFVASIFSAIVYWPLCEWITPSDGLVMNSGTRGHERHAA